MNRSTLLRPSRKRFLSAALSAAGAMVMSPVSAAPTTVTVASTIDDTVTPLLYATRSGLFSNAGLTVQLEHASSGGAITSAVMSAAYDIGKSSLVPLFNAHLGGLPAVILAPAGVYDDRAPYAELVVAADAPIHAAKDLNGKIIGVPALNDLNNVAANAWVDRNGGDWRSLRFVEVPASAAGAALAQHRIDAAVILYPALADALQSGKVRILGHAYSAIARTFLFSGWFTTRTWLEKNADIAGRFSRALAQAGAYVNGHHAETAPMLAEYSSIPVSVIAQMNRVRAGTSLRLADIDPLLAAAVKYGAIPNSFPIDQMLYKDAARGE